MSASYDILAALQEMEDELIDSMKRNMARHLKDEAAAGFDWTQWQAEKLAAIQTYTRRNAAIVGNCTDGIADKIADTLTQAYQSGKSGEEIRLLKALRNGSARASSGSQNRLVETGSFFGINENKLNALISATQGEFQQVTSSILRYQDDVYRKTIFKAAAQMNMGGKTLYQAIDTATKDFLAAGIQNVRYKNGHMVNISSYAEMALRTANLRAKVEGETVQRDKWGVRTVKMSSHGSACPKCLAWQGRVYYDDVYSSQMTPGDGKYPLLSDAIAGGALHPNCKHGVDTWIEGINSPPKAPTQAEIKEANRRYELEQKQRYCERQVRKYQRLKNGSLSPDNVEKYGNLEEAWREHLKELIDENSDVLRPEPARLKLYGIGENSGGNGLTSVVNGSIIRDERITQAVKNGDITLTLNPEKQNPHIYGSKEYDPAQNKSYFTVSLEELQEIVNQSHGTGEVFVKKSGEIFEYINMNEVQGYVVAKGGKELGSTNRIKIHYSKKRTHIVPTKEK